MKINFERLNEHLIKRGEYDEEDILESIEKLKSLPYEIFEILEYYLEDMFYEILGNDYSMDEDKLEEYYREAYPDYPLGDDISEADNYDDFCDNLDVDERQECYLKTFYDLGESEREEILSDATHSVAKNFGISPIILFSFCYNAFPSDPPNWQQGDLDDMSTQEEKRAEYITLMQEHGPDIRFVIKYGPEELKSKLEKTLKEISDDNDDDDSDDDDDDNNTGKDPKKAQAHPYAV